MSDAPFPPSLDDSGLHDLRRLAALARSGGADEARSSHPPWLAPEGPLAPVRVPPTATPASRPPGASRRAFGRVSAAVAASAMLAVSALAFALTPRAPAPATLASTSAAESAPFEAALPLGRPIGWQTDVATPPASQPTPTEPTTIVDPKPTTRRAARVPPTPRRVERNVPAAPAPATPPERPRSELDALLDRALGERSASAAAEALPTRPSTSDVTATLRGLQARIARCSPDDAGLATARVTFDGATGRVREIAWTGAAPESAACIEAALRSAQVPRFSQDAFTSSFPYRL